VVKTPGVFVFMELWPSGEVLACKPSNVGSIPTSSSIFMGCAPGRRDALQATLDEFDSHTVHHFLCVAEGNQVRRRIVAPML
jgi:hypothetical protein